MTSPRPRSYLPRQLRRPATPHRNRTMARRPLVVLGSVIALTLAGTGIALAAPPTSLPGNAEYLEQKWQPAYDYDVDGCYPTPAIGPDGTLNGGLNPTGTLNGGCHDQSDLDNTNGYSRYKCNNGWCAIAYGLYFEKDQAVADTSIGGHRHDWEHVVVWVQNDQAEYVATSAHGEFSVYASSAVQWQGVHAKVVYHKDGVGTHCFRLGNPNDEPPENGYHTWQYPTLVGWNGYPTGVRDKLTSADFGSAIFGLTDGSFNGLLAKAMPAGIPFDPNA
jgi:hypothetical protein